MLATLRANLLASVLGLAAAIFLIIAVIQSVELNGFLWIKGARDKLADCDRDRNELRGELKRISDAKDKQGETTKGNIGKAEQGQREADKRAEKIERAPPTKDCDTPPEILGADL